MLDYFAKIYLYLLIVVNLFFLALHPAVWPVRRRPLFKPKAIWKDVLFLVSGLICLGLLNSGALGSRGVLIVATVLVFGSVYGLEAVWKIRARKDEDGRAT